MVELLGGYPAILRRITYDVLHQRTIETYVVSLFAELIAMLGSPVCLSHRRIAFGISTCSISPSAYKIFLFTPSRSN